MSAEGRLLRFDGSGWFPVGSPLPWYPHAPPRPGATIAPWILPRELEIRAYDVVVVAELAHQLVVRCEPDDPVVEQLSQQTMLFHSVEETAAWLAGIEVWIGRLLDSSRPWPRPPGIS